MLLFVFLSYLLLGSRVQPLSESISDRCLLDVMTGLHGFEFDINKRRRLLSNTERL
jgi:hypothetical protein